MRVVRAAVPVRIARSSAPIEMRAHGAVNAISLVEQHGGITAVETQTPCTVTGHRPIKPGFEEAGDDLDLFLHHRVGIFDEVGLIMEIVTGQRDERRRIPCVQVHPDLAGTARKHIARKLDEGVRHCHLVVRKVDGLETEALAERLETRQVLRVSTGAARST